MIQVLKPIALTGALMLFSTAVYAFDVKVGPLNVRKCTSGYPGIVQSPAFTVSKVPAGAKYLRFRLVDLDARGFNHGGGVVAYVGKRSIKAGSFKYYQPCPPAGRHRYVWEVTAQSKRNGGKLARAKYGFQYP